MTKWSEASEAEYQQLCKERLPAACACSGIEPGETMCPCAKKRDAICREITAKLPGDKRQR